MPSGAAHLGPARPAEMGSVSSALARSRNAVVQLGSSPPPQPEASPAAPAARRDRFVFSKSRRLARGGTETPGQPLAWDAALVAQPSPPPSADAASPELSAVLNRAESMSKPYKPRSRSAAGESPLTWGCGEWGPGVSFLESGKGKRRSGVSVRLALPLALNFFSKFILLSGSSG